MARRKTRYRARTRTIYKRARSGGGAIKPILDGVIAGAGGTIAARYLGPYGQPVATLGVGYFRNNATLKTLGAMQLGTMIATQFTGGNGNGGMGVFS